MMLQKGVVSTGIYTTNKTSIVDYPNIYRYSCHIIVCADLKSIICNGADQWRQDVFCVCCDGIPGRRDNVLAPI